MAETETSGIFFPKAPIRKIVKPIERFLHIESASGIVLLACTAIALILANSPWAKSFLAIWEIPFSVNIGGFELLEYKGKPLPLLLIINDGLMAIFFFVVGLEIKREIVAGELRNPRQALLPVAAAIGGMLAPALVFLALQHGQPGQVGWAIPMATDIAFVVGILALFGNRISLSLKILLLSLAIVDDLGAVLIIAFVFTDYIAWNALYLAFAGMGVIYAFNRLGVRSVPVYVLLGGIIWLAVLRSGVHPTVAGVLLGLLTPSSAWMGHRTLTEVLQGLMDRVRGKEEITPDAIKDGVFAIRETVSPLQRLETTLHPWVGFLIMPLFALANAGVAIEPDAVSNPVALAVALGLFIGKPVGIVLCCWLTVKAGLTTLPKGVTWPILTGGACLAGIGFTMALFIAGLSLPAEMLDAGKIGVLLGSLVSAVAGATILFLTTKTPSESQESA